MRSINLHVPHIVKTKKFLLFKKALRSSTMEAAGLLCQVLGYALELNPSGELDWDAEFLSELLGLEETRSNLVWETLVSSGWLEFREGRLFVNDWIEIAGPALIEKYRFNDRQRLINIWTRHGQSYGREPKSPKMPSEEANSEGGEDPTEGSEKAHSEFTVGFESEKNNGISPPFAPPDIIKEPPREPSLETLKTVSKEDAPRLFAIPRAALPTEERRDPDTRNDVNVLQEVFRQRLIDRADGKPVSFSFSTWGKAIKDLLHDGFNRPVIEYRHLNWLNSTDPFIKKQLDNPRMFYENFNLLEKGPLKPLKSLTPTLDGTNGRKPPNEGAATVTEADLERFRRAQEEYQRTNQL